jgi:hypothetical protein
MTVFLIIYGIINSFALIGIIIGVWFKDMPSLDSLLNDYCKIKSKSWKIILRILCYIICAPALILHTIVSIVVISIIFMMLISEFKERGIY